jgi:type IV pilus assembly protein PilX
MMTVLALLNDFKFPLNERITSTRQRGISLPIVLIFLVVLSVLGVTIIQGSTFGARIARNEADRTIAFQAAEAALRDAETDIKFQRADGTLCVPGGVACRADVINTSDFTPTCTAGLCEPSTTTTAVWETASLWDTAGASVTYGQYTGAAALPLVSRPPRYLIEYFKLNQSLVMRVTAMGFGISNSTQIMLQTSVKVRQ